jgi:ribonuclease E
VSKRTESPKSESNQPESASAGTASSETVPSEAAERESAASSEAADASTSSSRRRRSRGGRNRRKSTTTPAAGDATSTSTGGDAGRASEDAGRDSGTGHDGGAGGDATSGRSAARAAAKQAPDADGEAASGSQEEPATSSSSSRRRRRRRRGESGAAADTSDGTPETKAKTAAARPAAEAISGVEGSTRIEAKKQRRREGREAGRRRAPILSESEFLARRESVDRVMVIRQRADVTQIAVLEDNVLVEHYVALEQQSSLIGNVYLGRVQNVLPSMEAAFIDIGKGRNAVLYAGEVNWDLVGDRNQPRRIEHALRPGQQILVQVSKDPVGHKGARLTSQISLPGRYLVYVPGGGSSGISRKLPDTERSRLKSLLKDILPEDSGVIVRTAAEGASEEELRRDVTRLTGRWEEISKLVKAGKAPSLLYAEPDITLKVVRDLFTEDFSRLVISGDSVWDLVREYVEYVAPDLADRIERYDGNGDVFSNFRVDEQIAKALERKVWLPSGGSLVIDRTEAMTVVDVNTGKFTGSGGNLEQTVTKNNLEAAEEIVRQLRLRDIGGIIVIDFIDMVLENNRDLVLRRLVECLGRDRTRHQVAEVTSLGLVQMTRKRIGTGLLEAFSVPCETCHGRGVVVETEPVTSRSEASTASRATSPRRSSSRSRSSKSGSEAEAAPSSTADKHSAAAAATAAIAAALHLAPKQTEPGDEHADLSDQVSQLSTEFAQRADVPDAAETAAGNGAASASEASSAKSAAAKESPTKKSTSTRKSAASATTAPAKKATTKKATTKKATTKTATTKKASTKKSAAASAESSDSGAGSSDATSATPEVGTTTSKTSTARKRTATKATAAPAEVLS